MRFLFRQVKRLLKLTARLAVILPVAIVAALPVVLAQLRRRFEEMKAKGIPRGPAEPPPPPGERSLDDIVSRLREVPANPARPALLGMARGLLCLNLASRLSSVPAFAGKMYPYPPEFERVVFDSLDGTPIVAMVGIHKDGPRPGLVMSHGYDGSKNDHYIISLALTAFAGWGYNVLAIDLRNHGESKSLEWRPISFGWKEGEDLMAAAKLLGEKPDVTSVGIIGFSMGAASTMRASYLAREYPWLTGGGLAVNGISEGRRMLDYLSGRPPASQGGMPKPLQLSFRVAHKRSRRELEKFMDDPEVLAKVKGPFAQADFVWYAEKVTAPFYGVSPEEYMRETSPGQYLEDAAAPLLALHAANDPICPPLEMDELVEVGEKNANVRVLMMSWGWHCAYPYIDREWFETIVRKYFDYWADWE